MYSNVAKFTVVLATACQKMAKHFVQLGIETFAYNLYVKL